MSKRSMYWVDETTYVEGEGYRASVVTEGEAGHRPTGQWPNDGTGVLPYFWGPSIEGAKRAMRRANDGLGVSEADETEIMASSFRAANEAGEIDGDCAHGNVVVCMDCGREV